MAIKNKSNFGSTNWTFYAGRVNNFHVCIEFCWFLFRFFVQISIKKRVKYVLNNNLKIMFISNQYVQRNICYNVKQFGQLGNKLYCSHIKFEISFLNANFELGLCELWWFILIKNILNLPWVDCYFILWHIQAIWKCDILSLWPCFLA